MECSDTTGEPLKGHRPMFLGHSAPATRRPTRQRPAATLGHTAPATRFCFVLRLEWDRVAVVEPGDTTGEPPTRQWPALQPWSILPQPPRFVLRLEWDRVAGVEPGDTTGEPLKGHRPMFLGHSAPATRPPLKRLPRRLPLFQFYICLADASQAAMLSGSSLSALLAIHGLLLGIYLIRSVSVPQVGLCRVTIVELGIIPVGRAG